MPKKDWIITAMGIGLMLSGGLSFLTTTIPGIALLAIGQGIDPTKIK